MSSASTRKRLPIRPSLEHLRKQAKRLARLEQRHLTEAQRQLAADYGFSSWEALAANVESLRDQDETWRRHGRGNAGGDAPRRRGRAPR
jgi:hypothetical protein